MHSVTLVPTGGRAGDPAPLRTAFGKRGLQLWVGHDYRIMDNEADIDQRIRWIVSTAKYAYVLQDTEDRELLAHHWHPDDPFQSSGRSTVQSPHLHLSHAVTPIPLGEQYDSFALAEMHSRTGRVLLEDGVEFLITECGVHPLNDDWQQIIDANRARVWDGRTW